MFLLGMEIGMHFKEVTKIAISIAPHRLQARLASWTVESTVQINKNTCRTPWIAVAR